MTQRQLADLVDTTPQQIHKYETGRNRLAASRLWGIALAQSAPIAYYFDDSDKVLERLGDMAGEQEREAHEFVRLFASIPEGRRKKLLKLLNSIKNGK